MTDSAESRPSHEIHRINGSDRARIIHGDLFEVLEVLNTENNHGRAFDAVLTDPPYGLEFMGNEWDKLDEGLPQQARWKGRRTGGASLEDEPGKPSRVSFGGKRSAFKRCSKCGRRAFSGNPCRCDEPDWIIEHLEGPPSGMIVMQRWHEAWARLLLPLLRPGAPLLVFGGSRTFHRMTCGLEDAGFDIRDCPMWLYGSGFPKSLDVSKAIDKAKGAARERVGWKQAGLHHGSGPFEGRYTADPETNLHPVTKPTTELAKQFEGYGTCLKPAFEPICLAMRPNEGSFAENAEAHGVAGLNVAAARIPTGEDTRRTNQTMGYGGNRQPFESGGNPDGRWPSNVLLDGEAAKILDEQSGETRSAKRDTVNTGNRQFGLINDDGWEPSGSLVRGFADKGGASRFFYVPKASQRDRGSRCLPALPLFGVEAEEERNDHPTVKPTELTTYLAQLLLPPFRRDEKRVLLVPFCGSGSEMIGGLRAGWDEVWGIEREAEYVETAIRRIGEEIERLGLAVG